MPSLAIYAIVGLIAFAILGKGYESILEVDRAKQAAKLAAANAAVAKSRDDFLVERENHLQDMETAADVAREDTLTKLTAVQAKGAKDATQFIATAPLSCTWPQSVVDDINAARMLVTGRLRDDPGDGGVQAAPSPGQVPAAVRGPDAPVKREAGKPAAAGGRYRPLGAVQPGAPADH